MSSTTIRKTSGDWCCADSAAGCLAGERARRSVDGTSDATAGFCSARTRPRAWAEHTPPAVDDRLAQRPLPSDLQLDENRRVAVEVGDGEEGLRVRRQHRFLLDEVFDLTATIGPSGGVSSPKRRMSALLNGRSHRSPFRPPTTFGCRGARPRSLRAGPGPLRATCRGSPPFARVAAADRASQSIVSAAQVGTELGDAGDDLVCASRPPRCR